jgi:hypothetical protein
VFLGQQSAKLAGKVAVDTGRRFENLLRAIAAELHLLNGMTAAREMFGRSYFSLGIGEKTAVDQAVTGMVAGNFQWLTPESLVSQTGQQPMGFRFPAEAQTGKT